MSAAALNLPFAPGADNGDSLRSFALAAVVHCVLFGFLYFGIRWQSQPPEIISAELWTPVQSVPTPAPKVETPRVEPVKVAPPPEPPPGPVMKPNIAVPDAKKKPEVKPPPKVEKTPSVADEMARLAAAEELRNKAQNEIAKSAAAAKSSASQNQNWLRAVNSHIERRFVFDGSGVNPNLEARFEIRIAPSLNILAVRLLKPSGNAAFDAAAQRALENSSPPARARQLERGNPFYDRSSHETQKIMNAHFIVRWLAVTVLCCNAWLAHAQAQLDIVTPGGQQYPIAITNLPGEAALPHSIAQIVRDDLARSGLFKLIDASNLPVPAEASQVRMPDWKGRGADFLAFGRVTPAADGRFTARVGIVDVAKQVELGSFSYTLGPAQARVTAHRIADDIYEKVTGEKGFFNTKIAYVKKAGTRFDLIVADSDGQNEQSALTSREPIISPRWSPGGDKLAYVSFENRKPQIWVHEIYTSKRTLVGNFRGSNSAPAWSPDGNMLAIALTLSGATQIYAIPATGGDSRRLTTSGGIDTEPWYAPDGSIFFTSDRGGSPQIYRMSGSGGDARRITFKGTYNVSPRVSPDGKTLAYIARTGGVFRLSTLDLANPGQELTLTDTDKDESPSFAPNGRMLLYATEVGGRGVLAAVSRDGQTKQRISVTAADAREPAWGPYNK